jgi:hypothetical protein
LFPTVHPRLDNGFKVCDKLAQDIFTGKYMFANEDGEKDDKHLDNLQPGVGCFPALSLLAKDKKDTYERFLKMDGRRLSSANPKT